VHEIKILSKITKLALFAEAHKLNGKAEII
jgi:hypothetical protein